jgi:phosphatidylserine/phosphatidylglycerophosphate/cardiolipin synthase-like enzyme
MKQLAFLFWLTLSLWGAQLYFMPFEAKQAMRRLLRSIDTAHSTIDIAMFTFTNKTIAKRIKNAAKRGVKVRIILDRESTKDRYSQLPYLAKYRNIDLYLIKGKKIKNRERHGRMHLKIAIIDRRRLIFGSANWSHSAFRYNYELIYFLDDIPAAKKATKYFERILHDAEPY